MRPERRERQRRESKRREQMPRLWAFCGIRLLREKCGGLKRSARHTRFERFRQYTRHRRRTCETSKWGRGQLVRLRSRTQLNKRHIARGGYRMVRLLSRI